MNHREAIRRDALIIADQAKWAFQNAYSKAGRGLEAERGADTSRTEAYKLAGPTYDIELGDHRAREAYHQATDAVSLADVMLSGHLLGEGVTTQPVPVKLGPYATPHDLEQAVRRITWRLERITNDTVLGHVHRLLDKTVRGLSRALDHGPVVVAEGDPWCRVCRARAAGPNHAGRCSTCARRFHKTGKDELPKIEVITPWSAKREREKRGEGWGHG